LKAIGIEYNLAPLRPTRLHIIRSTRPIWRPKEISSKGKNYVFDSYNFSKSDSQLIQSRSLENNGIRETGFGLSYYEKLLVCGSDEIFGSCSLSKVEQNALPAVCYIIRNFLPSELFKWDINDYWFVRKECLSNSDP
jgi:hypothetical protein